jgi:glycosyltransferase involved in cell wall biosynthesis
MSAGETVSLIIPVYNEAEHFARLVEEIERSVPEPRRVLVVYDFDHDSTLSVATPLARQHAWIRLLKNNVGAGVACAIRAGFNEVHDGPAVIVMADLSDNLADVAPMLELYRRGFKIVCASRYMRGGRQLGGPLLKRTLSRLAGLSLYYLAGFPTHDATNNFRLYDANLVRELQLESQNGFALALELTAKAFARGEKIAEVPTTWRRRTAGVSRFRLFRWLPSYLRWYSYAFCSAIARNIRGRPS